MGGGGQRCPGGGVSGVAAAARTVGVSVGETLAEPDAGGEPSAEHAAEGGDCEGSAEGATTTAVCSLSSNADAEEPEAERRDSAVTAGAAAGAGRGRALDLAVEATGDGEGETATATVVRRKPRAKGEAEGDRLAEPEESITPPAAHCTSPATRAAETDGKGPDVTAVATAARCVSLAGRVPLAAGDTAAAEVGGWPVLGLVVCVGSDAVFVDMRGDVSWAGPDAAESTAAAPAAASSGLLSESSKSGARMASRHCPSSAS